MFCWQGWEGGGQGMIVENIHSVCVNITSKDLFLDTIILKYLIFFSEMAELLKLLHIFWWGDWVKTSLDLRDPKLSFTV